MGFIDSDQGYLLHVLLLPRLKILRITSNALLRSSYSFNSLRGKGFLINKLKKNVQIAAVK